MTREHEPRGSALVASTDPGSWLDRHGDALFSFAMTRLHNRDVAEDVVQETFLAALGARDRFTGASSERTWLVAILKNKIVDCIRRTGRERPARDVAADEGVTAELFERGYWRARPRRWPHGVEDREFREALDRCLERLPDRQRLAFRLREADRLETDEICYILQVSPTNLATLLYRARARLRECLGVTWGEPTDEKRPQVDPANPDAALRRGGSTDV